MNIFLVRPHPPAAILAGACPIPEDYKYNWQPTALKYVAYHLDKTFGGDVRVRIWHLMNREDDDKLRSALETEAPELVIFSEIDILVGEVNRWAVLVKKLLPDAWTLVGGKHTSLLAPGDLFPYQSIDFALRGDSVESLKKIVAARIEGREPAECPAVVRLDGQGRIMGPATYDKRGDIAALDGVALQEIPVENHPMAEYLEMHQRHPALISGPVRTASLYAGGGCAHRCVFCQSPVEYGAESHIVKTRDPEKVAEEIVWLIEKYGVNSIFSLEANLNLQNWLRTYECLERQGISGLAVSGFIRAADILEAHRAGILVPLTQKGLRVLSVGLDIPLDSERDIYRKAYTRQTLLECLTLCEELGILLSATFIGDPMYTMAEFQQQLKYLRELPVALVDIRLSIALRNTDYYRQVFERLIYSPDTDRRYYDRQNYRYQTIQFPGKITPAQTYRAVRAFRRQFLTSDRHLDYVLGFARRFPESIPFFRGQYQPVVERLNRQPEKLGQLASLLGLSRANH